MTRRYAVAAAVLVLALAGCRSSGGGDAIATGADSATVDATASTATASTATSSVSTVAPATVIASTTTTAPTASSGWEAEPIGTITGALGGIDTIAFAPNGAAVAFSLVDISCCSNRVFGWARAATGVWTAMDTDSVGFVLGSDGLGAYGGPTDVAWFDGRFIAVGTRGGQSEPERRPTATTWVSDDGISWTAFEEATDARMSGLTVALDGSSLLGVRTTDEGVAKIRSTKDGTSWSDVATVASGTDGSGLTSLSLSLVKEKNGTATYVLFGSRFTTTNGGQRNEPYAATSVDGRTWKPVALASPPPTTPRSFAVTDAVNLDGTLLFYGFGYGDSDEEATQVGWRSDDGRTSSPVAVTQPCGGTFTSIVVDERAPESTMFAICSVVVGPVEGDSVDIRTELVISRDGATFTSAPVTPSEWGEPSVDINIGPVHIGPNGSVSVPVSAPGLADMRTVARWTA